MSAEPTDRVKFFSLRKPSKKKEKESKKNELVFLPGSGKSKHKNEKNMEPVATSSPLKTGSVPSSPMVMRDGNGKVKRSSSLVNESQIHSARNSLKPVNRRDQHGKELSSSPDSSVPNKHHPLRQNSVESTPPHRSSLSGLPPTGHAQDLYDGELDPDAVYANIPVDEEDGDHIYGNMLVPETPDGIVPPSRHKLVQQQQAASTPNKVAPPSAQGHKLIQHQPTTSTSNMPVQIPAQNTDKPVPPKVVPLPRATSPRKQDVTPIRSQNKNKPSKTESNSEITMRISPNQTITINSNRMSPEDKKQHEENALLPDIARVKVSC